MRTTAKHIDKVYAACLLDIRLFLISCCFAFCSATRLCMIWAYSFCDSNQLSSPSFKFHDKTHRSILRRLGSTTLECDPVALVLETLRGDQTLDTWSLGVRFGAFFLWLDFTANNVAADLR